MATTSEKQAFIDRVWQAIAGENLGGLFPSILIAQAALESGWGKSVLAYKYNNYFGIKAGSSWKGKSVNMSTQEVVNGQTVSTTSNFRVYDSLIDSIRDRNKLLTANSRYAAALKAGSPEEQISAIKAAGYATATNYVSSVLAIVEQYDLKKFDELKKKVMSNKTLSIMLVSVGVLVALVGGYNLYNLLKK